MRGAPTESTNTKADSRTNKPRPRLFLRFGPSWPLSVEVSECDFDQVVSVLKENKQLLESEIIFQLQIWSVLVVRDHKCAGRTRWTWNNPMWTLGWTKNGWCSKTIREMSSWQTCQLMKWEKQFSSLPFPWSHPSGPMKEMNGGGDAMYLNDDRDDVAFLTGSGSSKSLNHHRSLTVSSIWSPDVVQFCKQLLLS